VFRPIIFCSVDDLLLYEQRAIDILKPEYNCCMFAGSTRGVRPSLETRAKLSAFQKGRGPVSAETRARLSAALKGRAISEEWRAKLSSAAQGRPAAFKGRKHSDETKEKLSAIASERTGWKHSEETKVKIAGARRGKKRQSQDVEKWATTMRGVAQSRNTSGFPGVAWHKQSRKWFGQFSHRGNRIFCGAHATPAEAYVAIQYRMAELGLLTIDASG